MKLTFLTFVVAFAVGIAAASAAAAGGRPTVPPEPIDDSQLHALTTAGGGATLLPTTRTVAHRWGSTLDPQDGLSYGYSIVDADPDHCSGAACDVTVDVDITPVILRLAGMTFSGSDVLQATVDSPEFALNDYGST